MTVVEEQMQLPSESEKKRITRSAGWFKTRAEWSVGAPQVYDTAVRYFDFYSRRDDQGNNFEWLRRAMMHMPDAAGTCHSDEVVDQMRERRSLMREQLDTYWSIAVYPQTPAHHRFEQDLVCRIDRLTRKIRRWKLAGMRAARGFAQ